MSVPTVLQFYKKRIYNVSLNLIIDDLDHRPSTIVHSPLLFWSLGTGH